MKITELRIGDIVTYHGDGREMQAEVLALINTVKCHKNAEVYIEIDRKINGVNKLWVDAVRLTRD